MEIFGLEKLSLVDYDGKVAATVFTGSCNFRCGFCHNGPLVVGLSELDAMPESQIFEFLNSRKGIIDGVCVTGGEPTLQKDLPDFCEKLKKTGLSVKVDTNGTNPQMIKTLFENRLCDYFAMDIKNDKENYAKTIGFKTYDLSAIEKSVSYLMTCGADYEFRTTLINEYHSDRNIVNIGLWIKGAKKYLLQKFKATDTCIASGLSGVEEQKAREFLNIMLPYVPLTKLRGY